MERPYKAFGYPILPAIYIVAAGTIEILLLAYKPSYTWPGLIIVLLGVPVYYLWLGVATGIWGGVFGAMVGAVIAYLLRPAAPLLGQLSFKVVVARGAGLTGLDRVLVPIAERSFNVLCAGLILGLIAGALLGKYCISRRPKVVQT
jgi:hypothetical protein